MYVFADEIGLWNCLVEVGIGRHVLIWSMVQDNDSALFLHVRSLCTLHIYSDIYICGDNICYNWVYLIVQLILNLDSDICMSGWHVAGHGQTGVGGIKNEGMLLITHFLNSVINYKSVLSFTASVALQILRRFKSPPAKCRVDCWVFVSTYIYRLLTRLR